VAQLGEAQQPTRPAQPDRAGEAGASAWWVAAALRLDVPALRAGPVRRGLAARALGTRAHIPGLRHGRPFGVTGRYSGCSRDVIARSLHLDLCAASAACTPGREGGRPRGARRPVPRGAVRLGGTSANERSGLCTILAAGQARRAYHAAAGRLRPCWSPCWRWGWP
jgi:hypothetical protein